MRKCEAFSSRLVELICSIYQFAAHNRMVNHSMCTMSKPIFMIVLCILVLLMTIAYISLWNLTVHRWKWSEATCMADFMGYQYSFCWWNYNDSWRWYGLDASSQDCTNTGTFIANFCCINFIYLFVCLYFVILIL